MPRPQVHPPESVLDAAEELLVERGRAGVTVRALSERAGVSNGSIYHAFGTLENVVAGAWLRRAEAFLVLQRSGVDEELARGHGLGAVQAAADAPARLADENLRAARLLVALERDDLLTEAVAAPVADRLRALDAALLDTLRVLARAVRGRADAAAVDVVTTCVVHLPTALLFPRIRAGEVLPLARRQLAAAVAAVLHGD
jgi:AcrR family transcriptional regulator